MRRTVSRLTLRRPCSWRAARWSATIVQRCRPSGGAEHANVVTRASASVSYPAGRPERAMSNTASSMPACRQAARGAPSGCAPDPQYFDDLTLRGSSIQARQDVGSVDLPRVMHTLPLWQSWGRGSTLRQPRHLCVSASAASTPARAPSVPARWPLWSCQQAVSNARWCVAPAAEECTAASRRARRSARFAKQAL